MIVVLCRVSDLNLSKIHFSMSRMFTDNASSMYMHLCMLFNLDNNWIFLEITDCNIGMNLKWRLLGGIEFIPIGMLSIYWKTFFANITNMFSIRNFIMSSSVYLLLKSESSITKYDSTLPNTKCLYQRVCNSRNFDNCCKCVCKE